VSTPTGKPLAGWRLAWRVMLVSAPPALLGLFLMLPALWPEAERIRGTAQAHTACVGRWCGEVLAIDGRPLSCRIDFIGLPGDCRLRGGAGRGEPASRLGTGLPVEATVMRVPSLMSWLGRPATDGLLLRLEHGSERLFVRSLHQHAWGALYGNWLLHAIYWPVVGLVILLWPGSRLHQRLWARLTWTAPPR
jgi:hypothetical protein